MGGPSPLLFFSDISWHALYQRPQHLAAGAARHAPVLWIEPATLGHPVAWTPVRVLPNLHRLSVPLFPHNARNRLIRSATGPASALPPVRAVLERTQRSILRRALALLGMPAEGCAVILENFQLLRLAQSVCPSSLLFDYIDDAFGFVAMPEYVRHLWQETVTTADAVTVTAARLRDQVAAVRQGPVHIVRNGVEFDRFAAGGAEPPPDLPADDRPVVGYVGSIYPWFDIDLVAAAAGRMPDTLFFLIGPTHPDIGERLSALRSLPNVRLPGPRPYTDIPAYLHRFRTGIIPFLRNRLTESVNPVKLYEYAAAGVPIVTTMFADDLEMFREVVHLARDREEFMEGIARAVREAADPAAVARLRDFARENDWSTRVDALLGLLHARPS